MSVFKQVDEYAATKAKEVLAPFRIGEGERYRGLSLSLERADRLEQAIAEAIHAAADRQNPGNPPISGEEY